MPYLKPARGFLTGLLIFIFAVHAWALYTLAYFYIWWLDSLLHFLGGGWLAALAIFVLVSREKIYSSERPFFIFVIVLSFAALAGVFWEFSEYGLDLFFGRVGSAAALQQGVRDNMSDLFFDLAGALAAHLIFKKRPKRL